MVTTTRVIAVSRDTHFKHIAHVLRKFRVNACPVVTDGGVVVGVVSEADLLTKAADPDLPVGLTRLRWKLGEESKVTAVTADGFMTSPAVSVGPDALRRVRFCRQPGEEEKMTRRDAQLDALIRSLGAAYYRALHGEGAAADVSKAVARVAEVTQEGGKPGSLPTASEAPAKSGRTDQWEVRDVMTTKVVSVTGHAGYKQIAELLHEHELTALPVLTPEGHVAGVVSEADLLRKQERQERTGWRPSWEMQPAVRAKTEALTATGLMTSPAVTIRPDALLGTAARLMSQRRIKRLPVVDREGKLIGIVSRADLLRVFLRPDAEIAAEASAVLTDVLLADPREARATARDGVVTLAGRLASQDRTEAAVRLTQAINGVVAVTSKLTAPPSASWPDAGDHGVNRNLSRDMAMRSLAASASSSSSSAKATSGVAQRHDARPGHHGAVGA